LEKPSLERIFEGLKDHKALRALKISVSDGDDEEEEMFDSFFHPSSQTSLSHKRHLEVTDDFGEVYIDGDAMGEIYSFIRFCLGSAGILDEPLSQRSSLVTTALVEGASTDFRRNALLLTNHADFLHQLFQFADIDDIEVQETYHPPRRPVRK
jgi:hypothetical protein